MLTACDVGHRMDATSGYTAWQLAHQRFRQRHQCRLEAAAVFAIHLEMQNILRTKTSESNVFYSDDAVARFALATLTDLAANFSEVRPLRR